MSERNGKKYRAEDRAATPLRLPGKDAGAPVVVVRVEDGRSRRECVGEEWFLLVRRLKGGLTIERPFLFTRPARMPALPEERLRALCRV
jgi:hypothetical protein